MKFIDILSGLILMSLQCKSPKFANRPHFAIKGYTLSKSKYQIEDLIDSIISKKDDFFWQKGRTYGEMLLNMKSDGDTITFFLLFDGSDLEWVEKPDSVRLLLADIGLYQNYNSQELAFAPKIDSMRKAQYEKKLDSIVISPVREIAERSHAYTLQRISTNEKPPYQWQICKNIINENCDTVFIDSYIKGKFLGKYEIIPKDSL